MNIEFVTKFVYLALIKSLYHYLEKEKQIPKGIFEFPIIRVPKKVRRVLSEDELASLYKYCQNNQEKAILILFLDSKIRAGELNSLTRENVFPDYIKVSGKEGERLIPIKPETYEMLCLLATSGPLFTNKKGRILSYSSIYQKVHSIMHRAGLSGKKLGPHIIRHSTAVQHIMHGGDLVSLQRELGHTTTLMTEKYAQLAFPDVKQRHMQIDVLGHIMAKANGEGPPAGPTKVLSRVICYVCNKEVMADPDGIKKLECPKCGQVGSWYSPHGKSGGNHGEHE